VHELDAFVEHLPSAVMARHRSLPDVARSSLAELVDLRVERRLALVGARRRGDPGLAAAILDLGTPGPGRP